MRLAWFLAALLVLPTQMTCAPLQNSATTHEGASASAPEIAAYARRAEKPVIEVFLPQTKDTAAMWTSLRDELNDDYDVVPFIVRENTTSAQMADSLAKVRPLCTVLVNNPTIRLYQEVQRMSGPENVPPAVAVMASYLQEVAMGTPNLTGIAYEVPAVTSFVNVRSLIRSRFTRVGVVRRQAFAGYIAKQRELAAQENFQIVDAVVSDNPSPEEVLTAVNALRSQGAIEALWVLNDNALLRQDVIVEGWIEALKTKPLPVMVGVSALVSKDFRFGSFAMLPDHVALGVQTADMIFELADADWKTTEVGIAQPLSVESVVDVKYAREHFGFREDKIGSVDRPIE